MIHFIINVIFLLRCTFLNINSTAEFLNWLKVYSYTGILRITFTMLDA